PSFFDAVFEGVYIMQQSILMQMMRVRPPDIYIKPDIMDIRMLEFYKADEVYRQAQGAKDKLKKELERLLA
ncbi:MAG: patatin-like phospholipase family protein, partial [Gammaproteobacteria bacterium]|nr:patatin-like phospholipase family protein [Gammaproteobacteria bacterium]